MKPQPFTRRPFLLLPEHWNRDNERKRRLVTAPGKPLLNTALNPNCLRSPSKRGEDDAAALYVMRIDGREPEKILGLPYSVSTPQWMPDGQRVVAATRVIPELAGNVLAPDRRSFVYQRTETALLGLGIPKLAGPVDRRLSQFD